MTRLFGIRDLLLGAGALSTTSDERARWLQAGVAADVTDLLAAVAGHRAGYLPGHGAVMIGLTASVGTALGVAALASGN
jgi:hypothetical protein